MKMKVGKILNLEILKVKTISGETLGIEDIVYVDKLRPKLENFSPVLYVTRMGEIWKAVKLD